MPCTIEVPPQIDWSIGETLQTFIDRAIEAAIEEPEVIVLVPPGRYRESIVIRGSRAGSLTVRPGPGGAAIRPSATSRFTSAGVPNGIVV